MWQKYGHQWQGPVGLISIMNTRTQRMTMRMTSQPGMLQVRSKGSPFVVTSAALCRGKPDSARTRDQICSLASVLQPLAKRAGFLTAREPLKPGSSGLKHVQTRTQLKHTYTQ